MYLLMHLMQCHDSDPHLFLVSSEQTPNSPERAPGIWTHSRYHRSHHQALKPPWCHWGPSRGLAGWNSTDLFSMLLLFTQSWIPWEWKENAQGRFIESPKFRWSYTVYCISNIIRRHTIYVLSLCVCVCVVRDVCVCVFLWRAHEKYTYWTHTCWEHVRHKMTMMPLKCSTLRPGGYAGFNLLPSQAYSPRKGEQKKTIYWKTAIQLSESHQLFPIEFVEKNKLPNWDKLWYCNLFYLFELPYLDNVGPICLRSCRIWNHLRWGPLSWW